MTITTRRVKPPAGHVPLQRMKSLLEAGTRVITAVVKRERIKRNDDEREAALAICRGCDKWNGSTCGVCGCFGRFKTWLETEHCPLAKW